MTLEEAGEAYKAALNAHDAAHWKLREAERILKRAEYDVKMARNTLLAVAAGVEIAPAVAESFHEPILTDGAPS